MPFPTHPTLPWNDKHTQKPYGAKLVPSSSCNPSGVQWRSRQGFGVPELMPDLPLPLPLGVSRWTDQNSLGHVLHEVWMHAEVDCLHFPVGAAARECGSAQVCRLGRLLQSLQSGVHPCSLWCFGHQLPRVCSLLPEKPVLRWLHRQIPRYHSRLWVLRPQNHSSQVLERAQPPHPELCGNDGFRKTLW